MLGLPIIEFGHLSLNRGSITERAKHQIAQVIAASYNPVFHVSEVDASDPLRNGQEALIDLLKRTGHPEEFVPSINYNNPHTGSALIYKYSAYSINPQIGVKWTKISGPSDEETTGGSGKHQQHRLVVGLDVLDPVLQGVFGHTIAIVAQHQVSLADLDWLGSYQDFKKKGFANIKTRARQAEEAFQIAADLQRKYGVFVALIRDINNFSWLDMRAEAKACEKYGFYTPSMEAGDTHNVKYVETDTGRLNSAFKVAKGATAFLTAAGVINKQVDGISFRIDDIASRHLVTSATNTSLDRLDHGALQVRVGPRDLRQVAVLS